jgi:hypothetical protein
MYLAYARLCDFKPKLEQFAVDARRSPKRVLGTHSRMRQGGQCANLVSPQITQRMKYI